MATADLIEELNCSICLSMYTDPVTLSCGHSFCEVCINQTWDSQRESISSCPECREIFPRRPELKRNPRLYNIVQHFLSAPQEEEQSEIFCTACVNFLAPATKICLLCDASLCIIHLRMHSTSEQHYLTKPVTIEESQKCSIHKEPLLCYCIADSACICASCGLFGDHKGHEVELLNTASEKKKEKLRTVLDELTLLNEELENRIQSLRNYGTGIHTKADAFSRHVRALIRSTGNNCKDIERQLLCEITRQEKEVLVSVASLIMRLVVKNTTLSMEIFNTEILCKINEPVIVLQDWEPRKANFFNFDRESIYKIVGILDVDLISVIIHRVLGDIVTEENAGRLSYVKNDLDLLLDIRTAANDVAVSSDLKTASWSAINQNRPNISDKFDTCQVLSIRSFFLGQHFWEVETSGREILRVGVAYPSMRRKGVKCWIGNNKKSWALYQCNGEYFAMHDSNVIELPNDTNFCRLGIYLDYEAGLLSFYQLYGQIRHLYTFSATFTEPLHAAFGLSNDWVRIQSCLVTTAGKN
ncbi:E3 ubiquitin/ISG15 ligase TRIM25-like [Discoglossus pictus]